MKRYAYGMAVFAVIVGIALASWPALVGAEHDGVSAAIPVKKAALPDVNSDTAGCPDCPAAHGSGAMSPGSAVCGRVGDCRLPAGAASEWGKKVARPSWRGKRPIWL